jgi:hypothetical protein
MVMLRWFVLIAIFTRVIGIIFSNDFSSSITNMASGKWALQVNHILSVNPDEILLAEVAYNYINGLGYVTSMENMRPGESYQKTGFRPSYPIFFHIVGMKLYLSFSSDSLEVSPANNYFKAYALAHHILSTILFAFAAISFVRICSFFFNSKTECYAISYAYLFYPSISHFVGNLPSYESAALSLFIISFDGILQTFNFKISNKRLIGYGSTAILSTLIRPQLLIILVIVFVFCKTYLFISKQNAFKFHKLLFVFVILFLVTAIPVMIKNYMNISKVTLSTQSGFAFFEGHNPFARGSWCGDCHLPQTPTYQYVHEKIPGFDSLKEVERSETLKELGIKWSLQNPLKEIILSLRKVAIYFLPYNSDNNTFNLFNAIVHTLVILMFFLTLYRMITKGIVDPKFILMIGPLVGSLILTLIFFVGYRWRYFAEPFMIIIAAMCVKNILSSIHAKKSRVG